MHTLMRSNSFSSSARIKELIGFEFGTRTFPLVFGTDKGFDFSSKNLALRGQLYIGYSIIIKYNGLHLLMFCQELQEPQTSRGVDHVHCHPRKLEILY